MPEEPISPYTPQGESGSPDPGGAAPVAPEGSPPSGTVVPDGTTPGSESQPLEPQNQPAPDPVAESLKEIPAEELQAAIERGEKYAKTLSLWRPVIEGRQADTEKFQPWQPIVDRFQNPERLTSQL